MEKQISKRKTENEIKYFTQNELKSLFKAIEDSGNRHAIRDLAIFRVAYDCALRASEIGMINVEDYSKPNLYCRRLKGSKNNMLELQPVTIRILNKYIKQYNKNDGEVLFTSQEKNPISRQTLNDLTKFYCEEAKIKDKGKWHFHTLKHSAAVHLAESGLDLKELQFILGHKNVANTEVYFQFTTTQQQVMYEKLKRNNKRV